MTLHSFVRIVVLVATGGSLACGSGASANPAQPDNFASLEIIGLVATVQPLTTTPQPGLLYVLRYQARESTGHTGATLIAQHFALSDGSVHDGTFNTMPPPHVLPGSALTIESSLSIYPARTPVSHVTFSIGFTDDAGHAGLTSAEADIAPVGAA